jgi:hypothetical protein
MCSPFSLDTAGPPTYCRMACMGLLLELLREVAVAFVGSLGPTGDRGILIMNTAGAFGCGTAAMILRALEVSGWASGSVIASIVFGLVGALLCPLYAHHNPSERLFAFVCLTTCILSPLAAFVFW